MSTIMDSKQDKVNEILRLKGEITQLMQNIRDLSAICTRYSNENQYLQDYIGTVMKSGDMK